MRATKIILWLFALLILSFAIFVYSQFFGTPWGKKQQADNMEKFLEDKYHTNFVIKSIDYNFLSETYQAYAYPKKSPQLLFFVEQDPDSKTGYSDTYPKVYWDSEQSGSLKARIKELFPTLDESTFKALRIVERGEFFGPHIPTYAEINASQLSCSIAVNIHKNWAMVNQDHEKENMIKLRSYLQSIHFPAIIEIRYVETESNPDEKVFYITEEGNIVDR